MILKLFLVKPNLPYKNSNIYNAELHKNAS